MATSAQTLTTALPTFWDSYGLALMIFGGWLLAGLVLDQIIETILRGTAVRRHSKVGEAFARSLRGLISWIGGLIGFWIAFYKTPFTASTNLEISRYLKVATVIIVTAFLARIAGRLISVYTEREDTRLPASSIFVNLVKAGIWVLGFAACLAAMGISVTPIITALGVGGLAVGLALQPTLDNLFSGIQVLLSRQIEPGDFVRLETGEEGAVEDVTWRNTTVRRQSGELVIVPNSVLGRSLVVNFSRSIKAYNAVVPTVVAYGTDTKLIEKIALEVASEVLAESVDAFKGENPIVRFTGIEPAGIAFKTVLPVLTYNHQWTVCSVFVERLQQRFAEAGIEGPAPVSASRR